MILLLLCEEFEFLRQMHSCLFDDEDGVRILGDSLFVDCDDCDSKSDGGGDGEEAAEDGRESLKFRGKLLWLFDRCDGGVDDDDDGVDVDWWAICGDAMEDEEMRKEFSSTDEESAESADEEVELMRKLLGMVVGEVKRLLLWFLIYCADLDAGSISTGELLR